MTRWLWSGALLLVGCGGDSVIETEFEAARSAAVADPGPAPEGWAPDGALHMSPALIDDLMKVGLETWGTLAGVSTARGPLGVRGEVQYDMEVRRVDIAGTDRCERCMTVSVRVGGDVDYRFGPVRGASPVTVDVALLTRLDVDSRRDQSFVVTLVTQEVDDVTVNVRNLGGGIGSTVNSELSEWGQQTLLGQMQPIELGTFGGEEFPLRALTVEATQDGGASLHFLTRSPTPAPVGRVVPKLRSGWQLDVSQQSLLGLAAKTSLEMGAVSHGVHVQPTGLRMRTGSFEMDLRLWKPEGRGWWRDYTVQGDIDLTDGALALSAKTVEETGQSEGALLADPLAAVGESVILSSIRDGVNQSLPLAHNTTASDFDVGLSVRSLTASSDTLIVKGDLSVSRKMPDLVAPVPGPSQPPPMQRR